MQCWLTLELEDGLPLKLWRGVAVCPLSRRAASIQPLLGPSFICLSDGRLEGVLVRRKPRADHVGLKSTMRVIGN